MVGRDEKEERLTTQVIDSGCGILDCWQTDEEASVNGEPTQPSQGAHRLPVVRRKYDVLIASGIQGRPRRGGRVDGRHLSGPVRAR